MTDLEMLKKINHAKQVVELRKHMRKEGKLFNSLDELLEEEYDGKGRIEKEDNTKLLYTSEDGETKEVNYYDCPLCGVVEGRTEKRKYDDIGRLSGSRGYGYYCRICDYKVREEVLTQS